MPEHNTLTGADLHEPKGVAAATSGQIYVANGSGSGTWTIPEPKGANTATNRQIYTADGASSGSFNDPVRMGFWDYNDAATTTTPIVLSSAATYFTLTNDEAGANTLKTYKLTGATDLWNETTNRFDWSDLSLGDTVDIRFDIQVETMGANHEIDLRLVMAEGHANQYTLDVHRQNFKSAGTYPIVRWYSIYMGDTDTLNNPSRLEISSDTGTTNEVVVNGWYVRALTRSNF